MPQFIHILFTFAVVLTLEEVIVVSAGVLEACAAASFVLGRGGTLVHLVITVLLLVCYRAFDDDEEEGNGAADEDEADRAQDERHDPPGHLQLKQVQEIDYEPKWQAQYLRNEDREVILLENGRKDLEVDEQAIESFDVRVFRVANKQLV